MTSALSFLEPIEEDLAEMERQLLSVGEQDFPWLGELLHHILNTSGKRARPAITLLVGQLFQYDPALHIPMAVAVELLHTASLVHDDTVDEASLRRGEETINAKYGDDVAILLGDYLFASSAEMVCSTENVRVIQIFSRTLRLLADGELREIDQAFDWSGGEQPYWARVERKTSSLFATAAESGAILGNASEPEIQAINQYGMALGTAFQVIDDILDFEGDAEEVGKPVGNDLRQGVLTLPALIYLERYSDGDPGPFALLRDASPAERDHLVEQAIALVRNSGAIQDAYRVAGEYAERGRHALTMVPQGPTRQSLEEIVDFVIARSM